MRYLLLIFLFVYVDANSIKPVAMPTSLKNKEVSDKKRVNRVFKACDIDKDNKISSQEFIAYFARLREKRYLKEIKREIKVCDKNGDGLISLNETVDINKSAKDLYNRNKCSTTKDEIYILDKDGDNAVGLKEAKVLANPSFDIARKMDKVVKKQVNYNIKKLKKKNFENCDKNKDTLLTLREATSRACLMDSDTFFELDVNKDNMLSFKEKSNTKIAQISEKKRIIKRKDFQNSKGANRLYKAIYACDLNMDRFLSKDEAFEQDCGVDSDIFKLFDTNKDGYIGQRESIVPFVYSSFEKADKNGDGYLDKNELMHSKIDRLLM